MTLVDEPSSELTAPGARLERLAAGSAWAEGPVWVPGIRAVRWSDIPNNRILQWEQRTGAVSVFRHEAEYPNGRAIDHHGRVLQCSHGRRAVEVEGDEGPEVLVAAWEGGRFNSPNDLVVASDGAVWFTDPPYGLHPSGREGRPGPQDYDGCFVFRLDPASGDVVPVVTDMVHPNGLAFSPHEDTLYVSDTGYHGGVATARHIRAYPVRDRRSVGAGRVLAQVPVGLSDGLAVDREGRVWSSAGDGVYVYTPAGSLVGHLPVPETVSNLTFGGDAGDELFITASTGLYRVRTTTGAA